MKKLRLRFIVLVLAVLLTFPLTGCQQLLDEIPFIRRTPVVTVPTVEPETTATAAPGVEPTPATLEEDLGQITLWLPPAFDPENGSPEGELFRQQLQAFTAANPDVTVDVRIKALSGSGGLLDSLTAASLAAPAALPGIIILPRSDLETAALNGLIMPLETESNLVTQADYFAFAEELILVKDTRYGLPFAADAMCMAYKSLQVVYPPTLWQEVIQLNKVLAFPAAEPLGLTPLLLYLDKGGGFTLNEVQITLDEEALQQTLLFLAEGANTDVFPYWLTDYTNYEESWQAVKDARAAYAVIWASQYLEELPENTSISGIPSFEEDALTLAEGWAIAFPQTLPERFSLYQQLAAYLVDTEFQGAWTESAGMIPMSNQALATWKNVEVSGILLEIAEFAKLVPSSLLLNEVGPLFTQATIEMLRKQTTYIESSNKIIKTLSE